jgi:hypothetical protein
VRVEFPGGNRVEDFLRHTGEMLVGRVHGPFAFRLILQPLAALIIACRAGLKDARTGRPAYCWAVITDPSCRREMLREGWRELARVFTVAVLVDLIYEIVVFHEVYPGQSLVVAAVLALLPYPLIRGSVNRLARCWPYSRGRARASAANRSVIAPNPARKTPQ